jgi:hypothetical protein
MHKALGSTPVLHQQKPLKNKRGPFCYGLKTDKNLKTGLEEYFIQGPVGNQSGNTLI